MEKKTLNIKGMHCKSCEILITQELKKVEGIKRVETSSKKGTAEIYFTKNPKAAAIESAVLEAGYSLGSDPKAFFSTNPTDYKEAGMAMLVLGFLYLLTRGMGLFEAMNPSTTATTSLGAIFLVGLTAGVSTCMALVGGLVLGLSARFAEKFPGTNTIEKFTPHLFFNAGRIFFFLVFGALAGEIGALLSGAQVPPSFYAFLTILIGIIMLVIGIQTTELVPAINKVSITLPKGLYTFFGIKSKSENEYSNRGTFILGGLTFFLPCGFTQAMQLYAISTGSAMRGALIMTVFAMGTAPGLLGIGGFVSAIKGRFKGIFFKFVGFVVVVLALVNIGGGYNLISLGSVSTNNSNVSNAKVDTTGLKQIDPFVNIVNGVQIIKMTQNVNGYEPNKFTIYKGVPAKWIINSTSVYSCASSLIAPKLGIRASLKQGENTFEFTPNEVGRIKFSCSMGMYTGYFDVVNKTTDSSTESNLLQVNAEYDDTTFGCQAQFKGDSENQPKGCGGMDGCSGCKGTGGCNGSVGCGCGREL